MQFVTVFTAPTAFEAQEVLGLLEEAGLRGALEDVHTAALGPSAVPIPVRVVVPAEDAERARAVLAEATAAGADGDGEPAVGGPVPGEVEGFDDPDDPDPDELDPADATPWSDAQLDAWSRRTLLFAVLGVGLVIFSIGALARALAGVPGLAGHPAARRRVRFAAVLAVLTLAAYLGFLAYLFAMRP